MNEYEGKVEFPKWVYFADGRAVLCPDETALAALPDGWAETPAAFVGEIEAAATERPRRGRPQRGRPPKGEGA